MTWKVRREDLLSIRSAGPGSGGGRGPLGSRYSLAARGVRMKEASNTPTRGRDTMYVG